ncbi:MAG: DUF1566 domain-containing protein [Spirochaetaceae bacterium]
MTDENSEMYWYNGYGNYVDINDLFSSVGLGSSNTQLLVDTLGSGTYAANACDSSDRNGYSDWFLPSKSELESLYSKKDLIGNFDSENYWSSSLETDGYAGYMNFSDGSFSSDGAEWDTYSVRAIRAY